MMWEFERSVSDQLKALSKWNASIFKPKNELSSSIIFNVTISLLFGLMSLILLILSSLVLMTSTFSSLQPNTL